jgi:hypothetical protein
MTSLDSKMLPADVIGVAQVFVLGTDDRRTQVARVRLALIEKGSLAAFPDTRGYKDWRLEDTSDYG